MLQHGPLRPATLTPARSCAHPSDLVRDSEFAQRRSNRRESRSGEASELTAGFGRPTMPDERGSGRLRMQTHTERARHFQHGGEARVAVLAKRLI